MRYFIIAVVFLLGACADQIEADRCVGYGFQPGTEAFANCRMQLAEGRMARAGMVVAAQQNAYQQSIWGAR